jgi:glucose 1-dehydrogenase
MDLAGQVALVTGASSGIGRAIALRLGRAGADVGVGYRQRAAEAAAVSAEIQKLGQRAIPIQGDVAIVADAGRIVADAVAQLGRLDILINNAGIEIKQSFLDVTEESYDRVLAVNLKRVLAVNLKGAFFCAQEAARQMIRQGGGGHIVNVSSVHEDLALPENAPYCASKGGLRMMMRTICLELAPHQITVNNVGPGAIATPINRNTPQSPELLQQLLAEIPLRRLGAPEEVAELVAYLVSPAAAYVTGSTFFIDGGLMRQTGSL